MTEEPTQPKPTISEPLQQPILQPPKRKLKKTVFLTILIVVILSSLLGTMGYLYWDLNNRHNKLQLKYDTLLTSHHLLQSKYNQLNASYQVLSLNYTGLKGRYEELSSDYKVLNGQYTTLSSQYASLFSNYSALSEAFNEPLSYEEIPSTDELEQWLASDKTDSIWYSSPNFICGDFAVMLSQHAKLKHWDIGIVGVFGYTKTYQSYAHALNAIVTVEGLVYVEPQNDHVWWYNNHQAIYEDAWVEIDNEWIYVQDYVKIVWYD